jgi:protein tyrosine/serine phosphatase
MDTVVRPPDWDRFVELDGCHNFRDLGGYPTVPGSTVRRGSLYRSDALHLVSKQDVTRLRDELGLRHIIDLRATYELETEGRGPLSREPIRFHHIPLFDADSRARGYTNGEGGLAMRYAFLAELAMEPIARVLALLAKADGPAVFHCAAGKDRTGVVAAIILALLEVADTAIVDDYALTQRSLADIIRRLAGSASYELVLETLPPDTLHAHPETMADFLALMRHRFGSFAAYAAAAGVDAPTLERLRARLLEG